MERHQALRLHPEEGVAVSVRDRLARNLNHVAEAAGHEQPEAGELVLQHCIGGNSRSVQHHPDIFRRPAEHLQNLVNTVEESDARVGRRGGGLDRGDLAGRLFNGDHIGESATRVDGNAESHSARSSYPYVGYHIHIMHSSSKSDKSRTNRLSQEGRRRALWHAESYRVRQRHVGLRAPSRHDRT
jgi:hypothetical protein